MIFFYLKTHYTYQRHIFRFSKCVQACKTRRTKTHLFVKRKTTSTFVCLRIKAVKERAFVWVNLAHAYLYTPQHLRTYLFWQFLCFCINFCCAGILSAKFLKVAGGIREFTGLQIKAYSNLKKKKENNKKMCTLTSWDFRSHVIRNNEISKSCFIVFTAIVIFTCLLLYTF